MNKHQHGKLTLEKNIFPLLLPRIEPATFRSRVLLSTTGLPISSEHARDDSVTGWGREGGGWDGVGGGEGRYVPSRKSANVGFIQSDERIYSCFNP